MRTLLVLATLAILTAPAVAADPLNEVKETVGEELEDAAQCTLILARPWESPVEPVLFAVGAAICIAT